MGSSSSRGQIEEFAIDFVNEGTKDIQFEGDRLDLAGFLGPPVVKLISVENTAQVLYQHQIFFDGYGKNIIQSQKSNQDNEAISGSPESQTDKGKFLSEAQAGVIPAAYAKTLANPGNLQRHFRTLEDANRYIFAPIRKFDTIRDSFTGGAKIELLFQVNLENWDDHYTDDFDLRFGHIGWLDTSDDLPSLSTERMTNLKATGFVLKDDGSGWGQFATTTGTSLSCDMNDMIAAGGSNWTTRAAQDFVWIKILLENNDPTLSGYSEILQNLGGVRIDVESSGAYSDEKLKIANGMFFISPTGADVFAANKDLLDHDLVNPNVLVSFRAVSRTGMTILTSSRFTGTIKYLVSFGG